MPTLIAQIVGDASLNGHFGLFNDNASEQLDVKANQTTYINNELEAGKNYILIIAVTGPDGKKYKIKVDGVEKAVYPTSEITLSGGRDDIGVLITA